MEDRLSCSSPLHSFQIIWSVSFQFDDLMNTSETYKTHICAGNLHQLIGTLSQLLLLRRHQHEKLFGFHDVVICVL